MKHKPGSYALADILRARDAVKYVALIERAELGGYHDFKFDIIPGHPEYAEDICPKITLVAHLRLFPELSDLVQRTIEGDFDDLPDAEDDARMAKEFGPSFLDIFNKKKD